MNATENNPNVDKQTIGVFCAAALFTGALLGMSFRHGVVNNKGPMSFPPSQLTHKEAFARVEKYDPFSHPVNLFNLLVFNKE